MANNYIKHLEQKFAAKAEELKILGVKMDGDFTKEQKFADNDKETLDALLLECQNLKTDIQNLQAIGEIESFAKGESKSQQFTPTAAMPQSLGEQFVSSESYKSATKDGVKSGSRVNVEVKDFLKPHEQKATFTTAGTGLNSTVNYQGGMILVDQQPLTVADLFSSGQTTLNAIPYIRETSFTNAAATVAEGAEKPEASFATQAETASVKKIAVLGKVTDEMFADLPMMRDYVNSRVVFMIGQKEEQQLLSGLGTGSQIQGVLNVIGIQTQAKATDTTADAVHKAITKVRTIGFFEPDAIVVHPNDWQEMKLAKDANGQYYGGGPFTGSYGVGAIAGQTYWGLRVVVTTAITEGTALVGAFKLGGQVWRRSGITVESTNTHANDFAFNLQTIRVEERLTLAIYRSLAFCTVTGV